jgi:hypothetical protein
MEDDFVPERHLGLWKEEGRSPWAAFLTRWPPVGYLPKKGPQETTYSVRLDRGEYGMTGKFFWTPTHDLSVDRPTPEEAKLVAASAIDEMIANLRVIAASLRGEPDCETTPPPK